MRRSIAVVLMVSSLGVTVARAQGQNEPPRPEPDRSFLLAQVMRAIDEKVSLLLEQGRVSEAITELEGAVAIEVPRYHPAYEMKVHLIGRLAMSYAENGRTDDAVKTVTRLLADVPRGTPAEATAYLNAGLVYRRAGMPEEALKAFDSAIALSRKLAEGGYRPPPGPPAGRQPGPARRP